MLQDHVTYADRAIRSYSVLAPNVGKTRPASKQDSLSALMLLAHDLRGPLSNLELLLEAIGSDTQSGDMNRIAAKARRAERVAQRMTLLLASVLERARNAHDPLAPCFETIDLRDLMEDSLAMNEAAAARSGIHLELSCHTSVFVDADPQLLLEVLDNLIGNAIKHGSRGTTVSCEAWIDGGTARIAIVDEGAGLSEEDVARLFRPFTTLSRGEPANGTSCGLGLWICRLIAERHGGRIGVSARADRSGSVFSLCIPTIQ